MGVKTFEDVGHPLGLLPFLDSVPRRIQQNDNEFRGNLVLTLVVLTRGGGLFKLSLQSKWKDLVLMARKSFHTISNFLSM